MSKKISAPPRTAPLQRVIAEPITDAAEQAILDKFRKRARRKQDGQKAKKNRNGTSAAPNSSGSGRG